MDGVERRLSAILSADVVGYSRLMAEDEDGTIRRLAAYRDEITLLVDQHGGRVVDFTGDNFLAEFPSAVNGTRCAVEIQGVLKARNASLASGQRMEFRMGIHLGDVRAEGERIFGDGVNIASRLEGLAEPGGLCISGTVHEQVRSKLDLDFVDLGEKAVKNILDPVRVFGVGPGGEGMAAPVQAESRSGLARPIRWAIAAAVLLAVGSGGWWLFTMSSSPLMEVEPPSAADTGERSAESADGGRTLAVLPFDNFTNDPDLDQMALGIAENVIARHTEVWPVVPRDAAFAVRGVEACEAAGLLKAAYVLRGSLQKIGEQLRVSAQLVGCPEREVLWSRNFDRELAEGFSLQDDVGQQIVSTLHRTLFESTMSGTAGPDDPYLYLHRRTREDNERARQLSEEALAVNPQDEWNWINAFNVHHQAILYGWYRSVSETLSEMDRLARGCLVADPRFMVCHQNIGFTALYAGDLETGVTALRKAVELGGEAPIIRSYLGLALAQAGRPDEAVEEMLEVLRLSPDDDPYNYAFYWYLAHSYFVGKRYEEASEAAEQSIAYNVHDFWNNQGLANLTLAASQAHLNRFDEARAALEAARLVHPSLSEEWLAVVYPHPETSQRMLDGLRLAGLEH